VSVEIFPQVRFEVTVHFAAFLAHKGCFLSAAVPEDAVCLPVRLPRAVKMIAEIVDAFNVAVTGVFNTVVPCLPFATALSFNFDATMRHC
uniref:hypothetical protein n=1 Tax=Duncaniella muris TaxID=2094150 RepID=UPI0025AF41B4